MAALTRGPVAIFPWGAVIEDYLDPLGLTVQDFARTMRGGWLFGYVAALASAGVRSVIVCASAHAPAVTRLTHEETGAPIWVVPGQRSGAGLTRGRPSLAALAQWRRTPLNGFRQVLLDEACATMLIQDYEHPAFDRLVGLSRSLRLPAFATFQGGDVTLSVLEGLVRKRSLEACRRVIVASRRERRRLVSDYRLDERRLVDIPNPLDADLWRRLDKARARRSLNLDPCAFIAINHGRTDIHRKGLDLLLQAWRLFEATQSNARLALIGAGQDNDALARLVASQPSVLRTARYVVDPEEIRLWLSAADVYVAPSRTEGMPVAPLEAMACGLPVIASDTHGLADIFARGELAGGMLVERGRVDPIVEALHRLAASAALRHRLGQAARQVVEQYFGVPHVGARLSQTLMGD
jgi:hypothetical protein